MEKTLKDFSEEELIKELQSRGYIRVLWQRDDIIERHKEVNEDQEPLTDDEVDNIVSMIESKHDCNVGLNWETLDYFIDQELNAREIREHGHE